MESNVDSQKKNSEILFLRIGCTFVLDPTPRSTKVMVVLMDVFFLKILEYNVEHPIIVLKNEHKFKFIL